MEQCRRWSQPCSLVGWVSGQDELEKAHQSTTRLPTYDSGCLCGQLVVHLRYSVFRLNEVQNDYLPTRIGVECEEQEVKPGVGREKSPTPIGVECRLV